MTTIQIPLTQGKFALIDECDLPFVENHNWYAKNGRYTFYAGTNIKQPDGTYRARSMHRLLLNPPRHLFCDHIDGDGLNNTRANLRVATIGENNRNSRTRKDNTTGFKGVTYNKQNQKFCAQISTNGASRPIGYYQTAEEAYAAYCAAALKLHGEFARLS